MFRSTGSCLFLLSTREIGDLNPKSAWTSTFTIPSPIRRAFKTGPLICKRDFYPKNGPILEGFFLIRRINRKMSYKGVSSLSRITTITSKGVENRLFMTRMGSSSDRWSPASHSPRCQLWDTKSVPTRIEARKTINQSYRSETRSTRVLVGYSSSSKIGQ